MTTPIRLGLVGLGTIARNQHLPALAATDGLELVAIASRHASLPDLPGYHDIEEMLKGQSGMDAVSLCTPPQGRYAQVRAALLAGCHVMMEKPPGATVTEVEALAALARQKGLTLYATWHSRRAAAVEPARALLAESKVRSVEIVWREDVRHWHPGQQWIWEPGGLGVFDPGINALSILTRIMPEPVLALDAELDVPANRQAPIAARVDMVSASGVPIKADFDWRQTGPQTWDIRIITDRGEVLVRDGGAKLLIDGESRLEAPDEEYRRLYQRFEELVRAGESEVDLRPLQLVADAFLMGRRIEVEPFDD